MCSRIAVLIPVYNNWPGLKASLRTLAGQSVSNDVLVVDDGSSPPISEEACKHEHSHCTVLRQSPNLGIVAALNAGVHKLNADGYLYIARLDAGDLCRPHRLERQSRFLDCHTGVMLIGSDTAFTDPSGAIAHTQRGPYDGTAIRRAMHFNSCFSHPSVMMRGNVFQSVGMYAAEDDCAEDYGLFFRIAEAYPVVNLDEVLTVVELNPKGLSISRRRRQLVTRLRIQLRHFDGRLPESYLGVVQTILLMFVPTELTLQVKRRILARRRPLDSLSPHA